MPDLNRAFDGIDEYVRSSMEYHGTPGMSIGITDRERTLRSAVYGLSSVQSGSPVTPETLFQIGSVSKSFTSIILMQLMEEGRLTVEDPVVKHVPWFDIRPSPEAITLHHLMTHTSGMVTGSDDTLSARSEVWALRETELSAPPGTHYHYSNSGYKLLGIVVEEITGRRFSDVLEERVLGPAGMTSSAGAITDSLRLRTAACHVGLHSDKPHSRKGPFVPASWFESDTADGAISSTTADMAAYMRVLLNRGRGPHGRIISEESFELMTRPHVAPSDHRHGDIYGYGLVMEEVDGRQMIGHEGGMVGHYSALLLDPLAGIGVTVMMNGHGAPKDVARFAISAVRSALEGTDLSAVPPPDAPAHSENALEYSGTYNSRERTLTVEARGDKLVMVHCGAEAELERREEDMYFADVPGMDRFLFRFVREDGRVVGFVHGEDWYAGSRHSDSPEHDHPKEWEVFVGRYVSYNPWLPSFRVVIRRGALVFIAGNGLDEDMTPMPDGSFRIGVDPLTPERLRFDMVVKGKALCANLSGGRFYRTSIL
jgi:D-alanyl-D-alanine carboxypeptidase